MILFTSCKIAFYKLNIYDDDFTIYDYMAESNFKGINLRKLCEHGYFDKIDFDSRILINRTLLKPL